MLVITCIVLAAGYGTVGAGLAVWALSRLVPPWRRWWDSS